MKKIILIPPVYGFICLVLMVLLFFLFPAFDLIFFPLNLFFVILILAGLLLIGWAGRIFIIKKTTYSFDKSKFLVKTGPYRFTRNPMYLGMLLVLFGTSFCLGNLMTLAGPVIFFLIINFKFIPFEEEKMEKTFGKEYINFKKEVRRWI